MMKYKLKELTYRERDELVSKYVLKFDCFETSKGIEWYNYHYEMGLWHYSSNIKNAFELVENLTEQGLSIEILISALNTNTCKIKSLSDLTRSTFYTAPTVPEAITLSALLYSGFEFE